MSLASVEEFASPKDVATVVELLKQYDGSALIVAGGTFVHGLIARGLLTDVGAIIDIHDLNLDYVRESGDGLMIGATTTFAQLAAAEVIQNSPAYGTIRDALTYPPPQIMNVATVGGCVASSCVFFDMPVSLLALNAAVQCHGDKGARSVPLTDFFVGLFENSLNAAEFVAQIEIPAPAASSSSAFVKLETNANDLAILNVGVSVTGDGDGNCQSARVFLGGGVGEAPVRASAAEAALTGQVLAEEAFKAAGAAARAEIEPFSDHRGSAEYRKYMSGVLVERALQKAAQRLSG